MGGRPAARHPAPGGRGGGGGGSRPSRPAPSRPAPGAPTQGKKGNRQVEEEYYIGLLAIII